jgi:hypothetical protein
MNTIENKINDDDLELAHCFLDGNNRYNFLNRTFRKLVFGVMLCYSVGACFGEPPKLENTLKLSKPTNSKQKSYVPFEKVYVEQKENDKTVLPKRWDECIETEYA